MTNSSKFSYDNTLLCNLNIRKYAMVRTLLFLVFVGMTLIGGWLVIRRTGNYDIDYFTKILGWILLIPGIWGLLESLSIIQ